MNRTVPKIGRSGQGRSCLPPIAQATPGVAVRVAAVHLVAVVQVERDRERRLGVGRSTRGSSWPSTSADNCASGRCRTISCCAAFQSGSWVSAASSCRAV